MRKNKKLIAILTTLLMLLTILPLGAGVAFGATGYSATVTTVDDNKWQPLGTVSAEIAAGLLSNGHAVNLSLPTNDFKFYNDEIGAAIIDKVRVGSDDKYQVYQNTVTGVVYYAEILVPMNYEGNANALYDDSLVSGKPNRLDISILDTNEIQIRIAEELTGIGSGNRAHFRLYLHKIFIEDGYTGDIELNAERTTSISGFPQGKILVGRCPGGRVDLAVPELNTFTDSTTVRIRLRETVAGSLVKNTESLRLTLPSGFAWAQLTTKEAEGYPIKINNYIYAKDIGGGGLHDLALGEGEVKDDEIKINVTNESSEGVWLELLVKVTVDDETKAQTGEDGKVMVRIGGKSDTKDSEAPIAFYGEYGSKIEAKATAPKVIAGMLEQEITDIVIKETAAGSLVNGRTIILTLPNNAKWGAVDKGDSDKGCSIDLVGFPGRDGRAAKWEVTKVSTKDPATLELEDLEVVLEAGVTGDLEIEVSGTAGVSGKIKVAEAIAPVEVKADGKPEVRIGLAGQKGADLTITEVAAGAIGDFTNAKLIVDLPDGMKFDKIPKVEITEGDLDINESGVKRQKDDIDDNQLVIPIDRKSSKASTIKISDIIYTLDRNVPEGDVTVKIKGSAVVQVHDKDEIGDYYSLAAGFASNEMVKIEGYEAFRLDDSKIWPQSGTAAKVAGAVCVTPAPGEVKPGVAVFTIGDTKYKIGDKEETMDVAPYVKNNRTYLPVRYVAYALGVTPGNILWDNTNGTVTLIKGDRVIQVQIKSKAMLINGAKIVMDVAPEIKDGRTMLPFRWIAQALGASVEWDEATKTVTMKL